MRKVVGMLVVTLCIGITGAVFATPVLTTGAAPTVAGVDNATSFFDTTTVTRILPLVILGLLIGGATGMASNRDNRSQGAVGGALVGTGAGVTIGAAAPLITTGVLTGFTAAPLVSGPMLPVEGDLFFRNPAIFAIFMLVPFALAAWRRRQTTRALAQEKVAHHVE